MAAVTRCPQCGARVGEGAEWCTQCYADLRPPAPEVAAPVSSAPGPAESPEPPEAEPGPPVAARARHRAPGGDTPAPGWPCPQCGTVNDLAAAACSSCGSGFLAALAADRGIPTVPALTGLSRGARIAVALGSVAGILALLAAVLWLFG
ncbi:MAG TPA: zinc ribbon domain-containing protein [Mycobacteriales bacterium]|nr:zinc ribbon domain-containing protein [Mycobacteriales bacterium]